MATLLVSDTSVLIDLQRGAILQIIFKLPFDIGVPDALYVRELEKWEGPALLALGLRILVLDGDGVQLAQNYRFREPKLSVPDAFALALAKTGGHILLAGDSSLRRLAGEEVIECHGVLWLLDQLEEQKLLTPNGLAAALSLISSHPRCRLPQDEVRKRLAHYRRN